MNPAHVPGNNPGVASPRGARSLLIGIGVALIVLVILEIAGRIGLSIIQPGRFRIHPTAFIVPEGSDRAALEKLAEEYSRELAASYRTKWHSYVYWRRIPFRGKYINVDKAGIRKTWNSTPSPSSGQVQVFVFGGSTLWGTGARDEFTIPSLLSKRLSARLPGGAWVTNFGEAGYVSTQEVIALILELRRGNVPDIAVFYDGYNDSASVVQNGVAGLPQNEENRIVEFNSQGRLNLREGFVNRLALYRFSRWASRWATGSLGRSRAAVGSPEPLAAGVVDAYFRNIEIVSSLARTFGFQAVFFWQPTLYTKKNLSERERRLYGQFERYFSGAAPLFGLVDGTVKQRLAEGKLTQAYDLSNVFGDDGSTLFIDQHNHPTEAGNDRVADAMARVLQNIASRRK